MTTRRRRPSLWRKLKCYNKYVERRILSSTRRRWSTTNSWRENIALFARLRTASFEPLARIPAAVLAGTWRLDSKNPAKHAWRSPSGLHHRSGYKIDHSEKDSRSDGHSGIFGFVSRLQRPTEKREETELGVRIGQRDRPHWLQFYIGSLRLLRSRYESVRLSKKPVKFVHFHSQWQAMETLRRHEGSTRNAVKGYEKETRYTATLLHFKQNIGSYCLICGDSEVELCTVGLHSRCNSCRNLETRFKKDEKAKCMKNCQVLGVEKPSQCNWCRVKRIEENRVRERLNQKPRTNADDLN